MRRAPIFPLLFAALLLAAALPAAGEAASVAKGAAGPCRLGASLPAGLEPAGPNLYRTPDAALHCRVEAGRVAEIRITSPLYFTEEHLLRVGGSTITDVVAAHGSPAGSERDEKAGNLVLVYPNLRAHFPLAADPSAQRGMKLSRLDLVAAVK